MQGRKQTQCNKNVYFNEQSYGAAIIKMICVEIFSRFLPIINYFI